MSGATVLAAGTPAAPRHAGKAMVTATVTRVARAVDQHASVADVEFTPHPRNADVPVWAYVPDKRGPRRKTGSAGTSRRRRAATRTGRRPPSLSTSRTSPTGDPFGDSRSPVKHPPLDALKERGLTAPAGASRPTPQRTWRDVVDKDHPAQALEWQSYDGLRAARSHSKFRSGGPDPQTVLLRAAATADRVFGSAARLMGTVPPGPSSGAGDLVLDRSRRRRKGSTPSSGSPRSSGTPRARGTARGMAKSASAAVLGSGSRSGAGSARGKEKEMSYERPDTVKRQRFGTRVSTPGEFDVFGHLTHRKLPDEASPKGLSSPATDISYQNDRVMHGIAPPKPPLEDTKSRLDYIQKAVVQIPASLIPKKDRVVVESDVAPLGSADEPFYKFDTDKRKWVMEVFPSLFPSGRRDATLLEEWLDANAITSFEPLEHIDSKTARTAAAMSTPARPVTAVSLTARHAEAMKLSRETDERVEKSMDLLKKAQVVYSVAFNEVIRQVSTHCLERGQLLARVWKHYLDVFERLVALMDPMRVSLRRTEYLLREARDGVTNWKKTAEDLGVKVEEVTRDLERTNIRLTDVTAQLETSERNGRKLDILRRENDRLHSLKKDTLAANNAHRSATAKRLVQELLRARKRIKALKKNNTGLNDEVTNLSNMLESSTEKLVSREGMLKKTTNNLYQAENDLKHMRDILADRQRKMKELLRNAEGAEALIREKQSMLDAANQRARAAHTGAPHDHDACGHEHELDRLRAEIENNKSMISVLQLQLKQAQDKPPERIIVKAEEEEEEEDDTKRVKRKPKWPLFWKMFLKNSPSLSKLRKSGQLKSWSLPRLRQMILDCYIEKIKYEQSLDSTGQRKVALAPFVCDYFFNRYGVKRLVQVKLQELMLAIKDNLNKDPRIDVFARACGLWGKKNRRVDSFKFYLTAFGVVMVDLLSAGASGEKEWVTDASRTFIPKRVATVCARRMMSASPVLTALEDDIGALPNYAEVLEMDAKREREKEEAEGAKRKRKRRGVSPAAGAKPQTPKDRKKLKKAMRKPTCQLDSFLALMSQAYVDQKAYRQEQWREIFKKVDDDGNGVLDVEEFQEAMSLVKGNNLSKQRIRMLFVEAMNDTGREFIDQEQFVQLVQKHNFQFDGNIFDIVAGGVAGSADAEDSKGDDGEGMAKGAVGDLRALYTRNGFDMIQDGLADHKEEFLELKDTWAQLKPAVEEQIVSTYQSPAIRILLRHRCDQIESLIVKLNRNILGGADGSGTPNKVSTSAKEAWVTFRELVKDVQDAVKARRQLALAVMQRVVRGWRARREVRMLRQAMFVFKTKARDGLLRALARARKRRAELKERMAGMREEAAGGSSGEEEGERGGGGDDYDDDGGGGGFYDEGEDHIQLGALGDGDDVDDGDGDGEPLDLGVHDSDMEDDDDM